MNDEHHKQEQSLDSRADTQREGMELAKTIVADTIKPYIERVKGGLQRMHGLIALAARAPEDNPGDRNIAEDILRAVVVLIHAHLEDFLRTLAGALLPAGDETCLNGIPLAGIPGRPEKFLLGKLVHHKGKLVDDVLRESVSEYLERRTFNNTEEISQTLEAIGVDVSKVDGAFPAIQEMMKRRHQIVHRADRIDESDPTKLAAIGADEINLWIEATIDFISSLLMEVTAKLLPLTEAGRKITIKAAEA
jgi:hypothetical protein